MIKKILREMAGKNVDYPTEERKTWLVRFDYVLSIDGDSMAVDVEYEFENEEDMYLISIYCPEWKRNIYGTEVCDKQHDDLNAEAIGCADAYGIFKKFQLGGYAAALLELIDIEPPVGRFLNIENDEDAGKIDSIIKILIGKIDFKFLNEFESSGDLDVLDGLAFQFYGNE